MAFAGMGGIERPGGGRAGEAPWVVVAGAVDTAVEGRLLSAEVVGAGGT
eukprot:CAMPEP_0184425650 /NCGR_PEP_ID=MMETSP0738-20130409/136957_1 /TAXON_ID=385413 /ORGANISM="Thalassiosira miniscula, Strain CCMP1093" /LENGTH=48 /DNA_ID= /DNA_START= /DNA_END= /DNA_ORIENTATION=